jgi:hypothetical protein
METLNMLAASDANVIVEAPCSEGIFLPTKVADYAYAGRPMLAASPIPGTLHDILSEYGGGLCASCTSVENIYMGLSRLFDAWMNDRLEIEFDMSTVGEICDPDTVRGLYERTFYELCM